MAQSMRASNEVRGAHQEGSDTVRRKRSSFVAPLVAAIIALGAVLVSASFDDSLAEAGVLKVRYGPGLAADSLNNTVVGGSKRQKVSYRFRATATSGLTRITVYMINGPSGYSAGTGGELRVTVRPDNGKSNHRPTEKVLAREVVSRPPSRAGVKIDFESPPRLAYGKRYHIVFENRHPRPGANYASLNGLFVFDETSQWQPAFDNRDWAQLVKKQGSAWTAQRGPGQGTITPIMALQYANGKRSGVGYMEVWSPVPRPISGASKVREQFTVSGQSRTVSKISVRLKRVSGTSPLRIELKRQSGTTVASGFVPAASIALADGSNLGGSTWATVHLSAPIKLKPGKSYRLVLSTASDTTFSIHAIRQGSSHSYPTESFFKDGHAEHTNGSGWRLFARWGHSSKEGDLQFHFR